MKKLILSSLRFHWRAHVGVLLGTMLAAAVLTGSLLVGDSVDGSLRKFALQRLGNIHYALHTPNRFFSRELAAKNDPDSAAILQLRGMAIFQGVPAQSSAEGEKKQINHVQVLGVSSNVWNFCDSKFHCLENEVLLGRKLATALGANVGDEVSLRIEKPSLLPRGAPLAAQKSDTTVRGLFRIKHILSDDNLGRFSLSANQVVPYNAFINFQWLENRLELNGKANLIVGADPIHLNVWDCVDFSLHFRENGGIVQLESERVYLDPEAARAALAIPGAQGTLTYLANSISKDQKTTPYSFVLAQDGTGLRNDEILINRWLANELSAEIGDSIEMSYFELLPSNQFKEQMRAFVVREIIEMADLDVERQLAPQFPGLTDVDRCADWDAGIPMDEAALDDEANEAYWEEYKQTPKAIVSLSAGQAMWSNQFGELTSVRWNVGQGCHSLRSLIRNSESSLPLVESNLSAHAPGRATVDRLEAYPPVKFREEYNPAAAGFIFQPVREQALAAVDQALDFGQLFVGMSFFLIIAALMLTGLLFVFGVQQRAEEMGLLLATGWTPGRVRAFYLAEGGAISLIGSAIGAWVGTGYTRFLIWGLSRYWQGAVANSAIQYFAKSQTVLIGAVVSFICALFAMFIAIRHQSKHSARELLAADFQCLENRDEKIPRVGKIKGCRLSLLPMVGTLGAVGIVITALTADVQSVTTPFFGAGALLLVSGILFCGAALRRLGRRDGLPFLNGMVLRNVARRRGRSLTVIGLLACGSFLVFAVSSMKEDVTAHADEPGSGTGGFAFFGESTLPIFDDLGGVRLRVRDGDDASCLNLNRAQSPRVLGVDPDALSARKAFLSDEDVWKLLKEELPDGVVPALAGDADTMMWGLEKKVGNRLMIRDERGGELTVQLVGMLPMRLSVFQGTILIAENQFVEKFPAEEGYRMFLMSSEFGVQGSGLARKYERAGLDVIPAVDRLLEFYAVESTYLAMFMVLGALGLAVGSMGMGVVVLRNVQDRRAELALLRATGYRTAVLWKLLAMEHGLLLAAGLAVGLVASALAMVPALLISTSQVSFGSLLGLLAVVAGCGILCMVIAIHISLRGDALDALRNE